MAGSDLPSSGDSPPLRTMPPRSAKRKRSSDDDDSAGSPPSRRATRSYAAALKGEANAVRVARRVAAGALWAAKKGRGRGLGVERMREVILGVRQARFLSVDHPDYPCPESYLSSFPEKLVGIDPVLYQAYVPEWKDAPSKEEADDYRAATLSKLGTIVYPPNMDISPTNEPDKTREELVDNCNCSHPGSEVCVRDHVTKARIWIKNQLGEEAFKNCGLDAMGEQVGELLTAVEKKKLKNVGKLLAQNKNKNFKTTDLEEPSLKEIKDWAKYYYNVCLPRRLARLTRAEHKKDEAVDTADEKSGQDDDNNEHRPRKKSKSFGSSTRHRKNKDKCANS